MSNNYHFFKKERGDRVLWVEEGGDGEFLFTFDRKQIFNLFHDYPWKLTPEQKRIFDKENPYWVEFFKDRQ